MSKANHATDAPQVSRKPRATPAPKLIPPSPFATIAKMRTNKHTLSPERLELLREWDEAFPKGFEVAGALDQIEYNLRREMVMGEPEVVATALWIAHTYVYDGFKMTPRLLVTSGGPDSGKTTLLHLVAQMANGGMKLNKATEAALGRAKDKYGADLTVALDQLDNALNIKNPTTGQYLDRLISGADRGSKQMVVAKGDDGSLEPIELDLFYPMALGKIGGLPSAALRSRCIVIQMHPATPQEAKELVARRRGEAGKNVRPLLMGVMKGTRGDILALPPPATDLINRDYDKWHPLLTIAEYAGGAWPKRTLAALKELESDEKERPQFVPLLCRVVKVASTWPRPVIFPDELDSALGSSPAAGEDRRKLLRAAGVKTRPQRRGSTTARGWSVAEIMQQGSKYLQGEVCEEEASGISQPVISRRRRQ
jgi:hypothetical protein